MGVTTHLPLAKSGEFDKAIGEEGMSVKPKEGFLTMLLCGGGVVASSPAFYLKRRIAERTVSAVVGLVRWSEWALCLLLIRVDRAVLLRRGLLIFSAASSWTHRLWVARMGS